MIFLPIKPNYAFAIKDKSKKVEFRKKAFKNLGEENYCIVYASSPYKKIIGYFKFKKIEEGSPSEIWIKYKKVGGIRKKDFYEYYNNSEKAYAIKISKFFPIKTHINPTEKIDGFKVPQSFKYLSNKEAKDLIPEFNSCS